MRRACLVIAVVVVTILSGLVAPAWADPKPTGDGPPLTSMVVAGLAEGLYCSGWGNPEPQLGGNSLHFGGKVICNRVGSIWFKVQLYQIVNGEPYPDYAPPPKFCTNSVCADTWTIPCVGAAQTQWTMAMWATFNGVHFVPYPGITKPKYINCE